LHEYLFIDEKRLDSYLAQLPPPREGKATTKVSLSIPGLGGIEHAIEKTHSTQRLTRIPELLDHLREEGSLSAFRPMDNETDDTFRLSRFADPPQPLVYESCLATKVIFPRLETLPGGPERVSVWVSEPNQEVLARGVAAGHRPDHEWEVCRGSFLYLIVADHRDNEPRAISGTSALQIAVDILGLRGGRFNSEPFGPPRFAHPVRKLEAAGGRATDQRSITSLYRIRAITNEQCAKVDGREVRTHDVLGYPIFIEQG
jgi:hypothetical protein